MQAATFTANPPPYSKACDTFRPRIRLDAAIRAGLGRKTLVHFFQPGAMLNSLVRQLISKGRPTSVHYRLGHVGPGKPGSGHIPHCNQIKLAHDATGELVQKITAPMGGLGLNSLDTSSLVRTLGYGQRIFGIPVQTGSLNLFAVGQSRKVFESKVNADATVDRALHTVRHLNADIKKPVPTAVLGEVGAVLDRGSRRNAATLKDSELATIEVKSVGRFFKFAPLQWNPAKILLASVAQVGTLPLRARLRVLFTHRVDGATVNAELLAGTGGELIQIKAREPFATKAKGVLLAIVAVVKDKIHRAGLLIQQAGKRFDSVAVHKQHTGYINSTDTIQQHFQRFALALYLPALNDRVSWEI